MTLKFSRLGPDKLNTILTLFMHFYTNIVRSGLVVIIDKTKSFSEVQQNKKASILIIAQRTLTIKTLMFPVIIVMYRH